MSFMKFAATTAVAALISTTAWAGTISTLEYNGSAAGGYRTVTLDEVPATVSVAGGLTSVSAGGFDMNDTTGGLGSSFIAWCLDLGAFLGTSGSHDYMHTSNPFQNGGVNLMEAGIARIQAMFNANYGNPLVSTDRDTSAGFQLALWELVYDTDFDIETGAFQASASDAVESIASEFLSLAEGYTGSDRWRLTFLESQGQGAARKQNLVTVSPVPLPASGIMLIAAVGGLVAARKRRKSA
jgi:hypothetical protein